MVNVIYEDNHLIALNKPAGLLVHSDQTGDETLEEQAKFYIKHQYNKPGNVFLGVIHRLDRPVSGVVVFARTSKALKRMNELLRERAIRKHYLAISDRRPFPEKGRLVHYLIKNRSKNIVKAYDQPKKKSREAKKAILNYELLAAFEGKALIKIDLVTGRPHQIRAQLAHIGCPILGDVKYGKFRPLKDKSIALHSHQMEFVHPVKKESLKISCPPPQQLWWDQFKEFYV